MGRNCGLALFVVATLRDFNTGLPVRFSGIAPLEKERLVSRENSDDIKISRGGRL